MPPLGLVSLYPSDGLAIGRLSMWFAPNAMWGTADTGATAYRRASRALVGCWGIVTIEREGATTAQDEGAV